MATPAQPTPNATATPTSSQQVSTNSSDVMPHPNTLLMAAKYAIEQDRAIMLDYYRQTASGTAFIGEDKETKERILVKNKEEFTSLIKKLCKAEGNDLIVVTENSLYIVSNKIQKRSVSLASLHAAQDD